MTTKEIFTVGIRLFGIWLLLRAVDDVLAIIDFSLGFARNSNSSTEAAFTHASTYVVVGFYLLAGAPHIVSLVYPAVSAVQPPPPATDTPVA